MNTYLLLLNTGYYHHKDAFTRHHFDLETVHEVAPGVGLVFAIDYSLSGARLKIKVLDMDGESVSFYKPDTFMFLGADCGITALPRALEFTQGKPPRAVVDLVNIYHVTLEKVL